MYMYCMLVFFGMILHKTRMCSMYVYLDQAPFLYLDLLFTPAHFLIGRVWKFGVPAAMSQIYM